MSTTMVTQRESGGGVKADISHPIDCKEDGVKFLACELLAFGVEYEEFQGLYEISDLMAQFKENQLEKRPCFEKMQDWFNSLQGRVEIVQEINPSVKNVWKQIIGIVLPNAEGCTVYEEALALVGEKNIIDAQCFKKNGIICVKDDAFPTSPPINLIKQSDLETMLKLREALFNPKEGIVEIIDKDPNGSFIKEVQGYFDKILTFDVGRELITKICNFKKDLKIQQSEISIYSSRYNQVELATKYKSVVIGLTKEGLHASILGPLWITLAHELIHTTHEYDGTRMSNHTTKLKDPRWTNREEYVTIGDPTKPLLEISENRFRQATHHPLRMYHFEGSLGNLTYQIETGIDHDIINYLKKTHPLTEDTITRIVMSCSKKISPPLINELLENTFGKECIEKNLFLIFLAASAQGETKILEMLSTEFGESEIAKLSTHKNIPLFLTLTKNGYPFNKLLEENLLTKEFELSKKGFKEVMGIFINKSWNQEIGFQLLTNQALDGPEKKLSRYNLFLQANLHMDQDILDMFKKVYPEDFTEFSEAKTTPLLIILLKNKYMFERLCSQFRNKFYIPDTILRAIQMTLINKPWSSEMALEFFSFEDVGNVINFSNFQNLYKKALEHNDIPILEKMIEVFPERIKFLNTENVKKTLDLIPKLEEIFKS